LVRAVEHVAVNHVSFGVTLHFVAREFLRVQRQHCLYVLKVVWAVSSAVNLALDFRCGFAEKLIDRLRKRASPCKVDQLAEVGELENAVTIAIQVRKHLQLCVPVEIDLQLVEPEGKVRQRDTANQLDIEVPKYTGYAPELLHEQGGELLHLFPQSLPARSSGDWGNCQNAINVHLVELSGLIKRLDASFDAGLNPLALQVQSPAPASDFTLPYWQEVVQVNQQQKPLQGDLRLCRIISRLK